MTKTDHSNYMSKAFQMENAVRAQALHWELSWYLPVHVPSMECMGGGAGWGGQEMKLERSVNLRPCMSLRGTRSLRNLIL